MHVRSSTCSRYTPPDPQPAVFAPRPTLGPQLAVPRVDLPFTRGQTFAPTHTSSLYSWRGSSSMADFLQRFLGGAKSSVTSVASDVDAGAQAPM